MPSSHTPYGARPVGTLSSSGSFTGKMRHIKIASAYGTAIFHGDFVKLVSSGTVEKETTTDAGGTPAFVGIFLGCAYTDPTTNQMTFSQYWPASTAASDAVAYVLDDPNVLFQMQADGSVAQTNLGNNIDVAYTAGSTAIGASKNAADQSTLATTATLPFRIVDFVDGPNQAVGDTYTDVILKFNEPQYHQYNNTTGV